METAPASRWPGELHRLLKLMDDDIARVYAEADIRGLKPTWVPELLRLHEDGPMTITELAAAVGRTHSALSQKVAAMRAAGLVRTTTGADARSKTVALTAKSRAITGRMAAEWRATEAVVAELGAELEHPMTRVVADLRAALERTPFHDRITARLARDEDWA